MSHGQAAPKVEHWQKHWTGLKEENGRISFTFSYEDELEHLDKILKYVARYVLSYFFQLQWCIRSDWTFYAEENVLQLFCVMH